MNDSETRALDSIVRRLESGLAALTATVTAFQNNWSTQDERAAQGRRTIYEKVEGFGHDLQTLKVQVGALTKDVSELKPAVTDWVNVKNQAMGAKTAAGILGNAAYIGAGGLLVVAGWFINHFLLK